MTKAGDRIREGALEALAFARGDDTGAIAHEPAQVPDDMDLSGFRLHPLRGDRSGTWAVTVRANWRVTFCFEGDNVTDINYEDYH